MANFLLRRRWFPQHLLVGLCRWLRIGPLLDPAITQAISLFGCYLRQGYTSFADEHEGFYAEQIQQCWRYWQTQLPAEDIKRLLGILRQASTPAQRASRFKQLFKQVATARLLEASHLHLTNRIHQNGWALGPSVEFLGWLADLPTTQVGAVPRYAVLRWALGEDADFWLPLRGPAYGVKTIRVASQEAQVMGHCAHLVFCQLQRGMQPCTTSRRIALPF